MYVRVWRIACGRRRLHRCVLLWWRRRRRWWRRRRGAVLRLFGAAGMRVLSATAPLLRVPLSHQCNAHARARTHSRTHGQGNGRSRRGYTATDTDTGTHARARAPAHPRAHTFPPTCTAPFRPAPGRPSCTGPPVPHRASRSMPSPVRVPSTGLRRSLPLGRGMRSSSAIKLSQLSNKAVSAE